MPKRIVYLEKSWVAHGGGAIGIFHYAVKVDGDWYEIVPVGDKKDGQKNTINGHYLNGHPKRDRDREARTIVEPTIVGSTYKTNADILDFNRSWIEKYPEYHGLSDNCQKYALDLLQFLVGGSFQMGIPLSQDNAWANAAAGHSVTQGYHHYDPDSRDLVAGHGSYNHHSRVTAGKAGAQWKFFGIEVEGPSAGFETAGDYTVNNLDYDPDKVVDGGDYIGADVSLFRAEAQVLGVGARVEPNLNTGVGIKDGQFKMKIAGFGFTAGKGLGFHTPLGSLGFGRF